MASLRLSHNCFSTVWLSTVNTKPKNAPHINSMDVLFWSSLPFKKVNEKGALPGEFFQSNMDGLTVLSTWDTGEQLKLKSYYFCHN